MIFPFGMEEVRYATNKVNAWTKRNSDPILAFNSFSSKN